MERGTGLLPRAMGGDALAHAEALRDQLRGIVLAMRNEAEGDGPVGGAEVVLGECDTFEGTRWAAGRALGEPLQMAWGLAVAERLHALWRRLKLDESPAALGSSSVAGMAAPAEGEEAPPMPQQPLTPRSSRHGLPDLPGVWCPPRPKCAARIGSSRNDARAFLNLLLQQKRIHTNEIRAGYLHCVLGTPDAYARAGETATKDSKLFAHAMAALNSLKRGPEAQVSHVAPEPPPQPAPRAHPCGFDLASHRCRRAG